MYDSMGSILGRSALYVGSEATCVAHQLCVVFDERGCGMPNTPPAGARRPHLTTIHPVQVYCGFVGASKRCEYAMMGCSVNLSARLMASAPKDTIQARGYGKGYAHGG